jgi:hypothetical protein
MTSRRWCLPLRFRPHLVTVALLAPAWLAPAAHAQCTRDTECKGERICQHGQCVDPVAPRAPRQLTSPVVGVSPAAWAPDGLPPRAAPVADAAPEPAPFVAAAPAPGPADRGSYFYESGHFASAGIASVHGWGNISGEYGGSVRLSGSGWGGTHLAGYGTIARGFQLGGYFAYLSGAGELTAEGYLPTKNDLALYGVGLSLKLGSGVGERVWVGAALDLGLTVMDIQGFDDTFLGIEVFPRIHVDVMLGRAGQLRFGLWSALGPRLVPFVGSTLATTDGGRLDISAWSANLQFLFGISLGG